MVIPTPYKFLGFGLVSLAVVATAYFGWQRYEAAITKAADLETQLEAKETELENTKTTYESIVSAMGTNEQNTTRIIERTRTIREEVDAYPITTDCLSSPAISHVLGRLSENAEQSTQD